MEKESGAAESALMRPRFGWPATAALVLAWAMAAVLLVDALSPVPIVTYFGR